MGTARIPAPVPRGLAVRLSVTERCQLRCTYCLPERTPEGVLSAKTKAGCSPELPTPDLLALLRLLHETHGIRRLRFTGGEPLLRRDLPELIAGAAELGIGDLALTTNAQRLAHRLPALRDAGLQRLNISLDSLHPETFQRLTRGGRLADTLAGIEAALAHGFQPLKLNTVVLGGINDDEVETLLHFALRSSIHLRFLELMPVGEGGRFFQRQYVSTGETLDRLRRAGFALEAMAWDPRETSRDYRVRAPEGIEGVCGFISPTSQPFCGGCERVRLTAQGHLHGCLARAGHEELHPLLAMPDPDAARAALRDAVSAAFTRKQKGDRFQETVSSMSQLGG